MQGIEAIYWAIFWVAALRFAVAVFRVIDGPFKVWLATDAQRRVARKRRRS